MDDKEIKLELEKLDDNISISSPFSIKRYIEYANKHNLVSRYYPILDCGFIVFNGTPIILRSEKNDTTTLSIQRT